MKKIIVILSLVVLVGFYFVKEHQVEVVHNSVTPAEVVHVQAAPSLAEKTPDPEEPAEIANLRAAVVEFNWGKMDYEDDWCYEDELTEEGAIKSAQAFGAYRRSRGKFGGVTDPDINRYRVYETYSKDSLKRLGAEGDRRALVALYKHPEASDSEKYWATSTSAIYGGTQLITNFARQLKSMAIRAAIVTDDDFSRYKPHYLMSLAWTEFAAMRGALLPMIMTLMDTDWDGKERFNMTEADYKTVNRMAKRIYLDVQRDRFQRGLSPLDNTQPKAAVQAEAGALARFIADGYDAKAWGGWSSQYIIETECVKKQVRLMKAREAAEAMIASMDGPFN